MSAPIITNQSQVTKLVPLPSTSSSPPQLATGTVSLFADASWSSTRLDIELNEYVAGARQIVPSALFDQATWVAFNLPVGTVMTLMDNMTAVPQGSTVADLSNCGSTLDLVGSGATVAVDLGQVGFNDVVSSFFYRSVDLTYGAIEMFDGINYSGARQTIFLAEWNSGQINSIGDWYMNDRLSSISWKTINDRQKVSLFSNIDGSGDQYNNIKGWGSVSQIDDLRTVRFNDAASSFQWNGILPQQEIIEPFKIIANAGSKSSPGLVAESNGINNSSVPQPVTVTLSRATAQTLTTETSDKYATGISSTFSVGTEVGAEGVKATESWSVTVSLSYEHTTKITKSITETVALEISQTMNAPPMTKYTATLVVTMGNIPPTVYTTTAKRWYDVPVNNSKQDPANNNWYLREESVSVTITGSLASTSSLNMQTSAILSSVGGLAEGQARFKDAVAKLTTAEQSSDTPVSSTRTIAASRLQKYYPDLSTQAFNKALRLFRTPENVDLFLGLEGERRNIWLMDEIDKVE